MQCEFSISEVFFGFWEVFIWRAGETWTCHFCECVMEDLQYFYMLRRIPVEDPEQCHYLEHSKAAYMVPNLSLFSWKTVYT